MDTDDDTTRRPIEMPSGLRSGFASAAILRKEDADPPVFSKDAGRIRESRDGFFSAFGAEELPR